MASMEEVVQILCRIPYPVWEDFVRNEPEWRFTEPVLERYGPSRFLTFMVMAGLNDYQLKGPAEKRYWPPLVEHVIQRPIPESPEDLKEVFKGFYEKERFRTVKIRRLERFLRSPLVHRMWRMTSAEFSQSFRALWYEIAKTMAQQKERKTIVFSMKCLGIGLLMLGVKEFDFTGIPVPVDARVRSLLERWGLIVEGAPEQEIQSLCEEILRGIRGVEPRVNMIHLDSFLWQMEAFYRAGAFKSLIKIGMEADLAKAIADLGR